MTIRKSIFRLTAGLISALLTIGCSANEITPAQADQSAGILSQSRNTNSDWQDQIIYFVFTDRFSNGDTSNDFNVKPNDPWAYHGGDLQGVINKLDYIKDLGATTIWITPPMDNRDNAFKADFGGGKFQDIWGYHGYWFKDFYAVDEHLGNMAKMQELVKKAHAKGIKVLIDIVVNHLDYDHEFAKDKNNPQGKYYNWFHHFGKIQDNEWNNPWKVENGELAELPDLAQENPDVTDYLIKASKWWIQQTGTDGFRIDTVKHVGHDFWKTYAPQIHQFAGPDFLLLGEVYDGNPEVNASYINDGLDSTFDFPFYYAIKDVFGQGKSMKQLATLFAKDSAYPNPNMLSPFIDNHDVPRFLHDAGPNGVAKLQLAMSLIMTMRGMPMIYYGTEVALPGGPDPDNRRDMPWNSRNSAFTNYIKKLTSVRKANVALRRGRQLEMWQDDQVYAFLRTTGSPNTEVITVLNNSDRSETRTIQIREESKMADGTALANLIGTDGVTVKDRTITVTLAPKEAKIFAPGSAKNSIRKK
jgi:alpha-amylase